MRPLVRGLSSFLFLATLLFAAPAQSQSVSQAAVMRLFVNTPTILLLTVSGVNTPLTGISFVVHIGAPVVIAQPIPFVGNCNGGTMTAVPGTNTATFTGGSLPAFGNCMLGVPVVSTTPGRTTVQVDQISSNELGPSPNTPPATFIDTTAFPTITKAFGSSNPSNARTTLTFTLHNPNPSPIDFGYLHFEDTFPAGLIVDTPAGATSTCPGFLSAAPGSSFIYFNGSFLGAGGTCTISMNVVGTTPGTKTNVTSQLDFGSGVGLQSNPATITISAGAIPALSAPMLLLLGAVLAGAAILVLRR